MSIPVAGVLLYMHYIATDGKCLQIKCDSNASIYWGPQMIFISNTLSKEGSKCPARMRKTKMILNMKRINLLHKCIEVLNLRYKHPFNVVFLYKFQIEFSIEKYCMHARALCIEQVRNHNSLHANACGHAIRRSAHVYS